MLSVVVAFAIASLASAQDSIEGDARLVRAHRTVTQAGYEFGCVAWGNRPSTRYELAVLMHAAISHRFQVSQMLRDKTSHVSAQCIGYILFFEWARCPERGCLDVLARSSERTKPDGHGY